METTTHTDEHVEWENAAHFSPFTAVRGFSYTYVKSLPAVDSAKKRLEKRAQKEGYDFYVVTYNPNAQLVACGTAKMIRVEIRMYKIGHNPCRTIGQTIN